MWSNFKKILKRYEMIGKCDGYTWSQAVVRFTLTKEQQVSCPVMALWAEKLLTHVHSTESASEKYFEMLVQSKTKDRTPELNQRNLSCLCYWLAANYFPKCSDQDGPSLKSPWTEAGLLAKQLSPGTGLRALIWDNGILPCLGQREPLFMTNIQ